MGPSRELAAAVGAALGSTVAASRPLSGGSINDAWALTLADRRAVFVKANAGAPVDMFAAEARGLAWLRAGVGTEAEALRIPEVLAVDARGRFLILEHLEPGRPCADFDARLGRGLAALHRSGAASAGFGLDHDNYVGSLPQQNQAEPGEDWPSFFRRARLEPMVARAAARGLIDGELRRQFDRLEARLPQLCGPPEPPARLHGDLWAGNLHRDGRGLPALIDPAVYAGHREIDLAMMRLFGGFSPRVFAAYEEAWPLAPGAGARVDLYQLYPLLVHVVLFGAGYLGQLRAALGRLR